MKKNEFLILLLVIFSFGPYVSPNLGLRLEHILIYGLFLIYFSTLLLFKISISQNVFKVLLLWILIVFWVAITSIWTITGDQGLYNIVAAFENVLQPVVLLLVMSVLIFRSNEVLAEKKILIIISRVAVVILSLNTLWIIIGLFFDLTHINLLFVAGRGSEISTVAERAAQLGRYSGIINQPLESGMLYSLGLFLWTYLSSMKKKIAIKDIIILTLLIVGGFFSVSKVFIFGGVPLFLIYFVHDRRMYIFRNYKYALFIPIAVGVNVFFSQFWDGYGRLLRYGELIIEEGLFQTIFRTRYGNQDTGVVVSFIKTWNESPLYGFGFGRHTAYDNAFLEFFMYGGTVALVLYVFIHVLLLYIGFNYYYKTKSSEAKLLLFLAIFVIIAGTGGPTIIANRFSTIFWVITCLLIGLLNINSKRQERVDSISYEKVG